MYYIFSITKVFGNQNSLNSNSFTILLLNPFGLRNPYDFLYIPGVINRLMKNELGIALLQ